MGSLTKAIRRNGIPLDSRTETQPLPSQTERSNWVASRVGLPNVGSTLLNKHGIQWVVHSHAALPTYESLLRFRNGEVQPQQDLYPVLLPSNFSPQLTEFFHAIDRCTTKPFSIVDTMPGRRKDGHVPGGNHIDTVCHPATNVLFLDAVRVHETVIAHELGHAWVQYVDECEDLRTMKEANDSQRMRMVGFIQSFVLDLKVDDLIRRKGFDMSPIDEDRTVSLWQLAQSLTHGYSPEHLGEEVFMSLLVADHMVELDRGASYELARVNESLQLIRASDTPLARLSGKFADSVMRHGYESHQGITASIDECLLVAFQHCGDSFDLDGELIEVNPTEPDLDKFPTWLPPLSPKTKTVVGKHMARNDIASDWSQRIEPSITGRARVYFNSPGGERSSKLQLGERIGPPNRYSDLPEFEAELLALKHLNQTGSYQLHGGPPFQVSGLHHRPEFTPQNPISPPRTDPMKPQANQPFDLPGLRPPRPYMAGTGRFLTAARWNEQLQGEHPYAYANNNPVTYIDPSGDKPQRGKKDCVKMIFCERPVHQGSIDSPFNHWFIGIPGCGWMGYGPQGLIPDYPGNSDNLPIDRLHCRQVCITPDQAKCLCNLKHEFQLEQNLWPKGCLSNRWAFEFCRPWGVGTYSTLAHNCQDFMTTVLNHCGLPAPDRQVPFPVPPMGGVG